MSRLPDALRAACHPISLLHRGGLMAGMLLIAMICFAHLAVWPVSAGEHIFRMAASHLPGGSQPDGKGAVDIIAVEAFRRIGVEFETIFLPGKRAKAMVNSGDFDGNLTGTPTLGASLPNAIMVPEHALSVDFVAISRNAGARLSGWDELSQYPVAYVRGHKLFDRHVKNTGDRLVLMNDYAILGNFFLRRSLDHGGVEFFLMSRTLAPNVFADEIGRTLFVVEPPLKTITVHFYIHKRYPDLVPRLDKVLREMRRDGTIKRLLAQAKMYTKQ